MNRRQLLKLGALGAVAPKAMAAPDPVHAFLTAPPTDVRRVLDWTVVAIDYERGIVTFAPILSENLA